MTPAIERLWMAAKAVAESDVLDETKYGMDLRDALVIAVYRFEREQFGKDESQLVSCPGCLDMYLPNRLGADGFCVKCGGDKS